MKTKENTFHETKKFIINFFSKNNVFLNTCYGMLAPEKRKKNHFDSIIMFGKKTETLSSIQNIEMIRQLLKKNRIDFIQKSESQIELFIAQVDIESNLTCVDGTHYSKKQQDTLPATSRIIPETLAKSKSFTQSESDLMITLSRVHQRIGILGVLAKNQFLKHHNTFFVEYINHIECEKAIVFFRKNIGEKFVSLGDTSKTSKILKFDMNHTKAADANLVELGLLDYPVWNADKLEPSDKLSMLSWILENQFQVKPETITENGLTTGRIVINQFKNAHQNDSEYIIFKQVLKKHRFAFFEEENSVFVSMDTQLDSYLNNPLISKGKFLKHVLSAFHESLKVQTQTTETETNFLNQNNQSQQQIMEQTEKIPHKIIAMRLQGMGYKSENFSKAKTCYGNRSVTILNGEKQEKIKKYLIEMTQVVRDTSFKRETLDIRKYIKQDPKNPYRFLISKSIDEPFADNYNPTDDTDIVKMTKSNSEDTDIKSEPIETVDKQFDVFTLLDDLNNRGIVLVRRDELSSVNAEIEKVSVKIGSQFIHIPIENVKITLKQGNKMIQPLSIDQVLQELMK